MSGRVWIFLSEKEFLPEQEKMIHESLKKFLQGWDAHGNPLTSSYEILHHQLVIVQVNESHHAASGCSIDKLTHCMQQLEHTTGLRFFNRQLIAFLHLGKLNVYPSLMTPKLLSSGVINAETKVFNLMVSTTDELERNFEIPLKESWLKKYLSVLH
jgi:hypothetical protein